MKKTLAAIAVLSAFAGSSFAANVTLYGVADLGMNYQHQKVDGEDAVDQFTMNNGQNSGSRFGLKASEELGNGMKVGVVLENGFNADDGKLGQGSRLFGRQASLYVQGDFGELAMGRMGALTSGCGTYAVSYSNGFGTGWGDTVGSKGLFNLGDRDRMDNTITYVTPKFAGVKVFAQYSFQADGQEEARDNQNKRYMGLGANYELGAFTTSLVVDTVKNEASASNKKDGLGITFDAAYDLGVTKVYGLAQYGKNENKFAGVTVKDVYAYDDVDADGNDIVSYFDNEGFKGYALAFGATAPVLGGTALAQVNYTDGKTCADVTAEVELDGTPTAVDMSGEAKRWGLAVAYEYPLSKRTKVYTFAGYNEVKYEVTAKVVDASLTGSSKEKTTEFGFGMVHKF